MKRDDIVPKLCRGKKVLDIGCAGPAAEPGRLHKKIADVASECIGIDSWEEGVQELKSQGYDVRLADAENFNLDEEFEVATLCELVEHLSNPGIVLSNVNKHLIGGGV